MTAAAELRALLDDWASAIRARRAARVVACRPSVRLALQHEGLA
jgi:hypothetical protein